MHSPIASFQLAILILGSGVLSSEPKFSIKFINLCNHTVWPAFTGKVFSSIHLPSDSPNQFGANYSGGFELTSSDGVGESFEKTNPMPPGWEGTIWTRQACDFSKGDADSCATGSCPGGLSCNNSTDIEMLGAVTRIGLQPAYNDTGTVIEEVGSFFVNISDAFDLPIELVFAPETDLSSTCFDRESVACPVDFNSNCPIGSQITANSNGSLEKLACRSTNETSEWFATYCPQIFGNSSHNAEFGAGSYNSSVTGYQALQFPLCILGEVELSITFCPINTIPAPPPNPSSLNQNVTSPPNPSSTATPDASRNHSLGTIVGSSIGSVIVVAICFFVVKMYLRKRQQKQQALSSSINEVRQTPQSTVNPFRLEDLATENARRRANFDNLPPENIEKNPGIAEVQTVATPSSGPETCTQSPFDQRALVVNANSPQEPTTAQRGGYMRRLFEDREFVAELQEFMVERTMDSDTPRRGRRAASPARTGPPSYYGGDAP